MEEKDSIIVRELDTVVRLRRELVGTYRSRAVMADMVARKLSATGDIVGRVSIVESVGGDNVPVDIPPETWVRLAHDNPGILGEGYYYIMVDPKTMMLVLASVSEAVKPSATAGVSMHKQLATVPLEAHHPLSIAGNVVPVRLTLRPLLAVHMGGEMVAKVAEAESPAAAAALLEALEPTPPTIPPDPDSPVAVPHPRILEALLAPAREGVVLGGLAVMDSLYLAGGQAVAVRLPWSVLVKHVLVTGTTGSGKTSLVKNMMLSAASDARVHIVVLDVGSDYVAGLLPGHIPGNKVTRETAAVLSLYGVNAEPGKPILHPGLNGIALIPCPGCRAEADYVEEACRYRDYLDDTLSRSYGKQDCKLELEEPQPEGSLVYGIEAGVKCGDRELRQVLHVAPRKIVIESVEEVAQLDPYMTARAREALRLVAANCGVRTVDDLLNALARPQNGHCRETVRIVHQETRRNLEARLRALRELDILGYAGSELPDAQLDYTKLSVAMERLGARVLVADLGYAAHRAPRAADPQSTKVLIGYTLLATLARHMEQSRSPSYIMLVVDEAHLFFPPERYEQTRLLRSSIERLARLGRSRGIAIVFSTHRETDVSPLISVLTNTKVYLRTDRRTADELPLPQEYRRRLPYYRDHAAVVASYALRGGYLAVKNAPPLIGHRTA